jgi:Flp pilus assembly protein CpaB
MRRARTLIFVFLIIVIAAVVGFLAYRQYIAPQAASQQQPAYVEVYIAAQPISQGATIKQEQLTTIKIAPENVVEVMYTINETHPDGEFVGLSLLVGQTAKFPFEQGVMITSAMVGDASSATMIPGPSWAALIPPGMTAISIPADRLTLSGYAINNGAHVNLNACFMFVDVDPTFQTALPNRLVTLTGLGFTADNALPLLSLSGGEAGSAQGRLELDPSLQLPYYLVPSSDSQRPRMVCQILLQDIVVMKLGDFSRDAGATIDTPSVPPTDAEGNPVPTAPPDIATLIVTPQDSIALSYLLHTDAELSLALRNPTDQMRQATEASTLQFLLSQYNIPVPSKLPYSLEPYTIGFCNLKLGNSDICAEQPTTAPAQ